jgi:Holliday junction resolvase RusA-like endonuclease
MRWRADGIPRPQGSKRAFVVGGRAVMIESSAEHLRTWRSRLRTAFASAPPDRLLEGPVALEVTFILPRPKRPRYAEPAVRPDLSKLVRAVEDELTGTVIADDAQIVVLEARKRYAAHGEVPGAEVGVWPTRVGGSGTAEGREM